KPGAEINCCSPIVFTGTIPPPPAGWLRSSGGHSKRPNEPLHLTTAPLRSSEVQAVAGPRQLSLVVRYHVAREVSEVVPVAVRSDTSNLVDGEPTMTTTTTAMGTLSVALELGQDKWLLACATQAAQKPRFRSLPARDLNRLPGEIATAKRRFGRP